MSVPLIGQSYRGVEGHSSYLLRQAWQALSGAMEITVRPHGLTGPQYGVLSVLRHHPGASGADLARACSTTPQAMNGVLGTLERESLIERRQHPTHGRILQVTMTEDGRRRLDAADRAMRGLRRAIESDFTPDELATVKAWLVATAERLERISQSRAA
jgi:DNA-binding MarR family transcriptional regulator